MVNLLLRAVRHPTIAKHARSRCEIFAHAPVSVVKDAVPPPLNSGTQWEGKVEGESILRLAKAQSAIVIVDMQKYNAYTYPFATVLTFSF